MTAGAGALAHAPERGSRPVAQHSTHSAEQDRCHPSALSGLWTVTERVDPAVVRTQQPLRQAVIDRSLPEPESEQLSARDLAMLPLSELRDRLVEINPLFPPHMGGKSGGVEFCPGWGLRERYVRAASCGRAIAVRSRALSSVSSSTPFSRATSRIVRFEATASFTISVALS